MFGGGRKKQGVIEVAKLSSLIADNLRVVGDVHFSGGLRVDGRVEGNLCGVPDSKALVVLSAKGDIVGNIRAYDAVINGTVVGDIEVEHFLELQSNAKITGSVRYSQLQMECGAVVDGNLASVPEKQAEQSASAVAEAHAHEPYSIVSESSGEESSVETNASESELAESGVGGR